MTSAERQEAIEAELLALSRQRRVGIWRRREARARLAGLVVLDRAAVGVGLVVLAVLSLVGALLQLAAMGAAGLAVLWFLEELAAR